MIATDRNASKPSRKTMISAGSMALLAEAHGGLADYLHAVGGVRMFALPPAGIAEAENLKVVKGGSEVFALADLELPLLENGIVEFDDAAAGGADQVIVVGVTADEFVVVVVL